MDKEAVNEAVKSLPPEATAAIATAPVVDLTDSSVEEEIETVYTQDDYTVDGDFDASDDVSDYADDGDTAEDDDSDGD